MLVPVLDVVRVIEMSLHMLVPVLDVVRVIEIS